MMVGNTVYKPAVGKPQDVNGVSVTEYFRDKLVRDKVVLVPHEFTFGGDPSKPLGEQAEKVLFDLVAKCKEDIPGVEIISFHGVRVVGMSPTIIREVDSCCFVTYQGRHYVLITEVKCNKQSSKSGQARKKAISQVDTFRDMLRSEIKIPDSVVDNFQVHVFWPNMSPTEACPYCAGRHPSLYEKPPACLQPGTQRRAKPEPPGFPLFQDMTVGDAFSDWVRSIISDPSKAVVSDVYEGALGFIARHCVGVLYDETVGRFCILGSDQSKLLHRAEQPLEKPLIIYGLSGTGKTISILARIQRISPKLDANNKALFICFEDNVIEMAKMKLKACQIDLTYIHFENFNSQSCQLGNIFEDETKLLDLIKNGFRYIYVDSAEDLGISTINDLLLKVLDKDSACHLTEALQQLNSQKGDFWITMDPKLKVPFFISTFVSFFFILISQFDATETVEGVCIFLGLIIQYWSLAMFLCLTTMSMSIWRTFYISTLQSPLSQNQAHTQARQLRERQRAAGISFGLPFILLLVTLLIQKFGDQSLDFHPNLQKSCSLNQFLPLFLFFHLPLLLLLLLNLVFYALLVFKFSCGIWASSLQDDSDQALRNLKFVLELFVFMGIYWLHEVRTTFAALSSHLTLSGCWLLHPLVGLKELEPPSYPIFPASQPGSISTSILNQRVGNC